MVKIIGGCMRSKKIFLLIIVLIIVTGCVKYDLHMTMKTDKSIDISLIDAFQKEYYDALSKDSTSKEEYESRGYTVNEYADNQYKGFELKKHYESIDQISSSNCGIVELTDLIDANTDEIILFQSSKNGTVTTYRANFTYDLRVEENYQNSNTSQVDYSEYSETMVFKYSISLPPNANIITSNSVDKTSDHTLNWNLEYGKLNSITFSFTIDDRDVTEVVDDEKGSDQTEIKKEEDTSSNVSKNTTKEPKKNSNYIFTGVIAIGIIAIFLIYKTKMNAGKKTSSTRQINHVQPPNNRNV